MNWVYDETRLQVLFEALKDRLGVVLIELVGGDDPQTIFETLNSRDVRCRLPICFVISFSSAPRTWVRVTAR